MLFDQLVDVGHGLHLGGRTLVFCLKVLVQRAEFQAPSSLGLNPVLSGAIHETELLSLPYISFPEVMMMDTAQWETARLDPTAVFRTPGELMARIDLSDAQKIELLRRWEYDARELEVAEEENMAGSGDDTDLLDEILNCLRQLEGGQK
ncbi:hypothetical protein [Thiohalobacter thiocyanaticus]|nr:hypothetical protein [Thiohalobacter thiocyanaticus]